MSNRLLLNDINDYVLPSQECVNPIFSINTKGTAKITLNTDDNELEMYFIIYNNYRSNVHPDIIKSDENMKAVISLNDCLACSGCITSAESVLVQQQSLDKFLSLLKDVFY